MTVLIKEDIKGENYLELEITRLLTVMLIILCQRIEPYIVNFSITSIGNNKLVNIIMHYWVNVVSSLIISILYISIIVIQSFIVHAVKHLSHAD